MECLATRYMMNHIAVVNDNIYLLIFLFDLDLGLKTPQLSYFMLPTLTSISVYLPPTYLSIC